MNVLQRMGPMAAPRTAIAPLESTAEATTQHAAVLRRAFRAWMRPMADADTTDDLALAVYEALANVVDHAYLGRDHPGTMTLWCAASQPLGGGRDVVISVVDHGAWRHCADPGWRGRGLPLMRRLTHSTSILCTGAGTTIQMRRRVAPDPDRP